MHSQPKFKPGDVIGLKGFIGYYTVIKIEEKISGPDYYYNMIDKYLIYILFPTGKSDKRFIHQENKVTWIDRVGFKVGENSIAKNLYEA